MDLGEVVVVESDDRIGAEAAEGGKEVPVAAQRVGRGVPHGGHVLAFADGHIDPFELEALVYRVPMRYVPPRRNRS